MKGHLNLLTGSEKARKRIRGLAASALVIIALSASCLAGCGGGGGAASTPPVGGGKVTSTPSPTPPPTPTPYPGRGNAQACTPSQTPSPVPPGPSPMPAVGLSVPAGLNIDIIANVNAARELAVAPNGDLFVGTSGSQVYIVPNADSSSNPGAPHVFVDLGDAPAAGVTLSTTTQSCALYVGTQFGVYRIPYSIGDENPQASAVKIASVRPGGSADHLTTSVAVSTTKLYASIGSSCDVCSETDPTRATIQQMNLDGTGMTAKAVNVRNAIALAISPNTGTLWAGGAGQDSLPLGHPYEYFDGVTLHLGVADYGWPNCEENQIAYVPGANCSNTVVPRVEFPAYQTIIGAAIYPASPAGSYHLPSQYASGIFVAMHGSWHEQNGIAIAPPRVSFVPMNGDTPLTSVNWSDPTKQWTDFITGFQLSDGSRIGRPTGIAVGPQGDLFVGDDQTGNIYRIRP